MLLKLTPLLGIALALSFVPDSAGQDQEFQRLLSSLAQKEARQQAQKFKLALNQRGFQGQMEMPYPEKIQVSVSAFELKNDTIKANVEVQGDCRITGVWTHEGQSINVKADVAAKVRVNGSARLELDKGDFFVTPILTDCDLQILSMSIQEPVELAEGSAFLTDIANLAFQKNREKLINQVNGSMKKYQIKY